MNSSSFIFMTFTIFIFIRLFFLWQMDDCHAASVRFSYQMTSRIGPRALFLLFALPVFTFGQFR